MKGYKDNSLLLYSFKTSSFLQNHCYTCIAIFKGVLFTTNDIKYDEIKTVKKNKRKSDEEK